MRAHAVNDKQAGPVLEDGQEGDQGHAIPPSFGHFWTASFLKSAAAAAPKISKTVRDAFAAECSALICSGDPGRGRGPPPRGGNTPVGWLKFCRSASAWYSNLLSGQFARARSPRRLMFLSKVLCAVSALYTRRPYSFTSPVYPFGSSL